ncbi:FliH/SctL family protein [Flavobacterium rhizosphaerae]|uniref:DUF2007 domain-containing protein n=1 Tax=Flavobacterium rhizosphaerae TaxID=3163298 RepID=A0ABW8YY29_9FLAO
MKHFVTAASYNHHHETIIIRHLLTDAGLNFYFENEIMASLYPGPQSIRLKVHPNDLDTVTAILNSFNEGSHLKIV